jgi:hypothetical protein
VPVPPPELLPPEELDDELELPPLDELLLELPPLLLLLDEVDPPELELLELPPGHVVPPGSQPVPQLTVWQW